MTEFNNQQQMLTLAMIAYSGFTRLLGDGGQDESLTQKVQNWLTTLEPVKGRWALCWGPATYRPSISLFDDAMMFVVNDTQNPSRYAVVVRGTNPLSPTDWLFGDIWADKLVPWPYAKDAKISLSTSLGLSILKSLHAVPSGPASFGLETVFLRAGASLLLSPLAAKVAGPLREVRDRVHSLAEQMLPESTVQQADAAIALLERRSSAKWAETKEIVAKALDSAGAEVQFDIFHFLERDIESRKKTAVGLDLATFLRGVTDAGEAEIWVTGHSKAGALASTLALWLADTQGTDLPEDQQWDPDRHAVVHSMTFAGPTAGNDAFCEHSDKVIGDRCHRVANELDMITHGWLSNGLNLVPGIYGELLPAPGPIAELAKSMAQEVHPLNYRQVGKNVISFKSSVQPKLNFLEQGAYQHVDAYLEWAGLLPYMTRKQLFGL